MSKIVLNDLTNTYNSTKINQNFAKIEAEFQDKVLYRNNTTGETNTVETDIDINSKRLFNLKAPTSLNEAARLRDVQNAISGVTAANVIEFTPYGDISSDTVQGAIEELQDEKVSTINLAAPSGSSLVGSIASGIGAVSETVEARLGKVVFGNGFAANGVSGTAVDPLGGVDSHLGIQAAIATLGATGGKVELTPGIYNLGAGAVGIIIAGSTTRTISIVGTGGGSVIFRYTGSGDAFLIDNSAGTSILSDCKDIKIDCTGAASTANGIRNKGAWRSNTEGIYITRNYVGGTGCGLFLDGATDGAFDVKMYRPYITNFGYGVRATGGDLSATAITNFLCSGGYVSGNTVNFKLSYALDVFIESTQSEAAVADGIQLDHVNNFTWIGGAIEGNGAYGINFGANVNGVLLCAGMFNNVSGNFNGTPLHFRQFSETALDLVGELVRLKSGTALNFNEPGITDISLKSTSGSNSISLVNNFDGTTKYRFGGDGILDLLGSGGYLRLIDGCFIQFFQGGVGYGIRAGTGSPEGVVALPTGSLFMRTDGGAGTSFYVKETGGNGATGWAAK